MKISIISKYWTGEHDGVGDYSAHLSEFLKQYHSHQIQIFTSTNYSDDNININNLQSIKEKFRLLNGLLNNHSDVIILQYVGYSFHRKGFPFWLALLTIILSLKKKRIFTIVHETYIRPGHSFKTKIYSLLQKQCLSIILKNSTVVFTSIERYLKQCILFQKNSHLLRIGPNIIPQTTHLKKNDTRPYFTLWGNRDHHQALSIFKEFNILSGGQCDLKIIGKLSDDNLNIIDLFIKNAPELAACIYVHGIVGENDLSIILSNTIGLLLIEKLEQNFGGFSLKSGISVAAIVHRTLIFSNKGDMTDGFLKHKEHLIFVPENSSMAAKLILETINNPMLIKDIKSNLVTLQQEFDWKNIANKINEHI
ncbi:glycosyltransferase [Pedobacter cryophilus]|uniref:Glycosyltransferase n=1 Tax=Pedobacter cryophilus TaxID=2571271 RepID=A0A4U1BZB1_9SPHI|nr:glycosyltransferase [Pedobacter cryophilus]TKB98618.1 glycosyltransferase [Pedobacter cryophilus]